jgi:hypothetical protein
MNDYKQLLNVGQRISELNDAFAMAKAKNAPPPDFDITARASLVKNDIKKLTAVRERMAALEFEIEKKTRELQPFEYPPDARSAGLRSELRAHVRQMKPEDQHNALRHHEYRAAMAEQRPEISGVSPTFYDAVIKEELEFKHGSALQELQKARDALETAQEAFESVRVAAENEARSVSGQLVEPAAMPQTKAWIED